MDLLTSSPSGLPGVWPTLNLTGVAAAILPEVGTLSPSVTLPPALATLAPSLATLAPVLATLAPAAAAAFPGIASAGADAAAAVASSIVANVTDAAAQAAAAVGANISGMVTPAPGVAAPTAAPTTALRDHDAVDPNHMMSPLEAVFSDTGKPFVIPTLGLIIGTAMMQVPRLATVGKLVLYFGAQSFMNIYMGWVMRTSVTVPAGTMLADGTVLAQNLTGCPAGFALTAMQQVVSFVVFCVWFAVAYFTPYRYTPKKLNSCFEIISVIIFGCVFALNIALNNFSLGYINVAVNLIIRSCLPLTTFFSQQVLSLFNLYPRKPCHAKEILLMLGGVVCAGVFTWARIMGTPSTPGATNQSNSMLLGVVMCILSLLCGSLNLALAGVLGETKLNVYDTVAYMAIPATIFLIPFVCFYQKIVPGEWPKVLNKDQMTDFEILQAVWGLNKKTVFYLAFSGVLSFVYNIIQFSIVHTLSPSATAFGGNFNKAALIFLTLVLPFLRVNALPGLPWIAYIWGAVVLNIFFFSWYSYLQIMAKQEASEKTSKLLDHAHKENGDSCDGEEDDEEEDDEDDEEKGIC